LKLKVLKYITNNSKRSLVIPTFKTVFTIFLQIIVYSWDLIKDIYFLVVYAQFFPISRNSFTSFGFQTFLILLLSILIPNLINIIVLLTEKTSSMNMNEKIFLTLFVFVSQSMIGYAINRIHLMKEKLHRLYSNHNFDDLKTIAADQWKKLEDDISKLLIIQSRLRLTEGTFESSIQATVLILVIAIDFRYF